MSTLPLESEQSEALSPELRRDRVTGRSWLAFPERPPTEVVEELKSRGWRWSGLRKQWHHPRRYPDFPPGMAYVDMGLCDYNAERADTLEERAGKREAEGAVRLGAARQAVEGIPFGQPVLVGHHSERRHRGAVEKHERNMRAALALTQEAGQLRTAAAGSRQRQEKHEDPVRARARVAALKKELSKQWLRPEVRADMEHQLEDVQQVATQQVPADVLEAKPGDLARVKGWLVLVLKANSKTLECMLLARGPRGSTHNYPKLQLQKIFSSGHPLPKYEGSCMRLAGGALGMAYCGHQHDTKLQASQCAGKLWPESPKHHRGTRMAEPLPIPREALALLGEATGD